MSVTTALRTLPIALCAAGLLALAPSAQAVATLTSPAAGAGTVSQPAFTWTLAPGDSAETLAVSSEPTVGAQGELTGRTKLFRILEPAAVTYRHDSGLYAGNYFWQVQTSALDAGGFKVRTNSAVSPFTVTPKATKAFQTIYTYKAINRFQVSAKWKGNLPAAKVTISVFQGRKLLWSKVDFEKNASNFGQNSTFLEFRNNKVAQGTALRSVVTIAAGPYKTVSAKAFLAP